MPLLVLAVPDDDDPELGPERGQVAPVASGDGDVVEGQVPTTV